MKKITKLSIASISTIILAFGCLAGAVAQTSPYTFDDGTSVASRGIIEIGNVKFDSTDLGKIYSEVSTGKSALKTAIETNRGSVTPTGPTGNTSFLDLANGVDSISDEFANQLSPVLKYIPTTKHITIKDTTYTGTAHEIAGYEKSDQIFTWNNERNRYTAEITVNSTSDYQVLAPGVTMQVNIDPVTTVPAIESSVWESIRNAADDVNLPSSFSSVDSIESLSTAISENNESYVETYYTVNNPILVLMSNGQFIGSDGSHGVGSEQVINPEYVSITSDAYGRKYANILKDCKVRMYYTYSGGLGVTTSYSGTGGVFGNGSVIDAKAGDNFSFLLGWSTTQNQSASYSFTLVLLNPNDT